MGFLRGGIDAGSHLRQGEHGGPADPPPQRGESVVCLLGLLGLIGLGNWGVPQHWRNQGSNRAVHCIDGKTPLNCQNIINDKLLNLVSGKDVFPGGVYQLNSSGFGPHKPEPLLRLTLWQSGFDPTDTVRRMSGLF